MNSKGKNASRGFIFSLDALFAAVVIVIAAGSLFLMQPAAGESYIAYETVSIRAHDNAIVDFYLGRNSAEICGTAKFCSCREYYKYTSNPGSLNTSTQKVCEVYG